MKFVFCSIFLGLCENEKYRGPIVAAGGAKVCHKDRLLFVQDNNNLNFQSLLPLALDGTPAGKTKAAQALAKIAITTNPENAFPGQRVCEECFCVLSNLCFCSLYQMLEVVRPILKLLKVENTALENFEALMALTNLAGVGDNVRKRILKEDGFASIEQYMYEEHRMLRRAATECMCNLVVQEEVNQHCGSVGYVHFEM